MSRSIGEAGQQFGQGVRETFDQSGSAGTGGRRYHSQIETGGREVTSAQIGVHVMAKLRDIDEVAYLRFASVHRRFEQADEFVDAIQALGRRVKRTRSSRAFSRGEALKMVAFKEEFPI